MTSIGRLLGAVLLLLLITGGVGRAAGIQPAAIAAVTAKFTDRLTKAGLPPQWTTATQLLISNAITGLSTDFRTALQTFADNSAAAPQPELDAFMANLNSRFDTANTAYFQNLMHGQALRLHQQLQLPPELYEDIVESAAFFTIATLETMNRAEPQITAQWQRRSAGEALARADATTDWVAITQNYRIFRRAVTAENAGYQDPSAQLYPTANDAAAAAQRTPEEWINVFAERLRRGYAERGAALDPRLLSDLAKVEYLMRGLTLDAAGEPEPAGMQYLRSLEAALANNPSKDRFAALEAILRAKEQANGFDRTELTSVSVLSGLHFAESVRGAYVLNDIGAGVEHGNITHRLQWYAIMEYFERHPAEFNFSPLELYAKIGSHDVAYEGSLAVGRPARTLWGGILDLPDGHAVKEFSHPDDVRLSIARSELTVLSNVLATQYAVRSERNAALLRQLGIADRFANNQPLSIADIQRIRDMRATVDPFLLPADRQRVEKLINLYNEQHPVLANPANFTQEQREFARNWVPQVPRLLADCLYAYEMLRVRLDDAHGTMTRAALRGQPEQFLVPSGSDTDLMPTTPPQDAIDRQVSRHDRLKKLQQGTGTSQGSFEAPPPSPHADKDVTVGGEHDVAVAKATSGSAGRGSANDDDDNDDREEEREPGETRPPLPDELANDEPPSGQQSAERARRKGEAVSAVGEPDREARTDEEGKGNRKEEKSEAAFK